MKFGDLTIKNFLTMGDTVSLNLADKGLVLIQGDNRDDTSARSNGAGKSTIGDAICWCLFGVTAREVSGDDVINNVAKKGCSVSLVVESDGEKFAITRHRKDKKYKNGLIVDNLTSKTGLTKGTDKLTQEVVNKIIGCSLDVFKAAIYAAQDSIPNLPGMTDKFLKQVVEEAAGIDRLAETHLFAQKRLKIEVSRLEAESKRLTELTHKSDLLIAELQILKDARDNFDVEKDTKCSSLESQAATLERVLSTKCSALHDMDDSSVLQGEIDGLNVKLALKIAERDVLVEELNAVKKERDAINFKVNAAMAEARKKIVALKDIDNLVGKPCGECGKKYRKEDLNDVSAIAKKDLKVTRALLTALKASAGIAEEAVLKAADELKKFGDVSVFVTENKAAISFLENKLRDRETLQKEIEELEESFKQCNLDYSEVAASIFSQEPTIEKKKKELEDLEEQKEELQLLIEKIEAIVQVTKDAVDVLGPGGVRSHILDTVTPHLNDRTSHYLACLSDGNISAIWNTLSKTKSGELREKFVIEVNNTEGASTFAGLSGGEKRKVRLATAMALQDVVSSRASKPIELWVADEIDDALDDAGLERLMMILDEKAKEKGTVLMVSHNSLSDWISSVTTVIKEGKTSRVEGDLVV